MREEEGPDIILIKGADIEYPYDYSIAFRFPKDTKKIDLSFEYPSGFKSLSHPEYYGSYPLSRIDIKSISHCVNLEELNLRGNSLQNVDLSPLSKCKNLKTLDISNQIKAYQMTPSGLDSIDLTPLSVCTDLQELILGGNKYTAIDLTPLSKCSNLQVLELGSNLESFDLASLKKFPNLEVLKLWSNRVSIDLSPITNFPDLQVLELGFSLESIDLTPLSKCFNLHQLVLTMNEIQTLDLSPLSSCQELTTLRFGSLKISEIDLTPLSNCQHLKILKFGHNVEWGEGGLDLAPLSELVELEELSFGNLGLKSVDLGPLAFCKNLKVLDMSNNQLQNIDLSPLAASTRLQELSLVGNKPNTLDLTLLSVFSNLKVNLSGLPYVKTTKMETFSSKESLRKKILNIDTNYILYNAPKELRSLELIKRLTRKKPLIRKKWKRHHLLQQALKLFNLEGLGLLDIEPLWYLKRMFSLDVDIDELKESFIKILCKQIERGGPTIGLDIDWMLVEVPELANLVDDVIRLRRCEIDNIVLIQKNPNRFDIRQLALTAYGYEYMIAAGMGVFTDKYGYTTLSNRFLNLGFEKPKVIEKRDDLESDHLSPPLKQYIWRLVEYNARKEQ